MAVQGAKTVEAETEVVVKREDSKEVENGKLIATAYYHMPIIR